MKKITCQEAALEVSISLRRLQQMCKNGEIKGAEKVNGKWMVPCGFVKRSQRSNSSSKQKRPLPIGISDYKQAVKDYYYVDKTLLIKDVIDAKTKVSLFTRPRRFGKTLTMDMLRVFFEKTNENTVLYFKNKMIFECGQFYQNYQGKYPTIFLTFKDVKCLTWDETINKIRKLIALEFQRHDELIDSSKLNQYEKEQYKKIANEEASNVDYQMSLQILSMLLYKHHQKECIILIDEYDTPIEQGHNKNFYNEIIDFMRNFFSGGLKDNNFLAFGFLTGILRIAKESIFSGLNNIKIYSVLDNKYSEYFGFTKSEVKEMLAYYDSSNKYDEVCEWYDGYQFGNTEIFNPWSLINYIEDNCFPKAFWQSTGSNDVIGEILSNSTNEIIENLHDLLIGKTVTTYIDTNVIYQDIINSKHNIYSFLLLAGYLKVQKIYPQNDGSFMCDVMIPNKEIAYIYEKEVLSKIGKESIAIAIQQAIFTNDILKLQKHLEEYLLESVSIFDGTNESFYHGMMLGLCSLVSNRYKIHSNIESGYGRLDIELCPTNINNPGFIFELKYVKNVNDLDKMSKEALKQIDEKCYDQKMKSMGITEIEKIGIAFCGKKALVLSK